MVLAAMDAVEITLRALMDGAGISADLQTLAFITMVLTFMIAARHLLKGVTRSVVTVLLILVLAHIVSILARHGAISSLHV
jgi:hypothetical protein